MAKEIERKFLAGNDSWKRGIVSRVFCRQAYVVSSSASPHVSVRARVMGGRAFLTLKGPVRGISRNEFEYEIPVPDANAIMDELCSPGIEKYRNIVLYGNDRWEIDEFTGKNEGLVIAEIELASENAPFGRPPWLGEEVTGKREYYNSSLAVNPYSKRNGKK